jgi:hypothetical protein
MHVKNVPEASEDDPVTPDNNEATVYMLDLLEDNSNKQDQVQDKDDKMTETNDAPIM